jgi:hypothetical protein
MITGQPAWISDPPAWRWEKRIGRGVVDSADDVHPGVVLGAVRAVVRLPTLHFACLRALLLDPGPSWRHCSLGLHIEGDARTSKKSRCDSLRHSATPDLVTEYENTFCFASHLLSGIRRLQRRLHQNGRQQG